MVKGHSRDGIAFGIAYIVQVSVRNKNTNQGKRVIARIEKRNSTIFLRDAQSFQPIVCGSCLLMNAVSLARASRSPLPRLLSAWKATSDKALGCKKPKEL